MATSQSFLQPMLVNSFMNVMVNDHGSQATDDISFWYPAYTQEGYYYVGMYATNNYNTPPSGEGMYVFKAVNDDKKNPCFMPPTGFKQIWTCVGNDSPCYLGIYNPIPPNGYVAIGTVAVPSFLYPPEVSQFPQLMCVRQDLVTTVNLTTANNLVWADHGDGTSDSVTVYQLPNSFACYAVINYPTSSTGFDINMQSS